MEYEEMLLIAKSLINPQKISPYVKTSDTVCVMETMAGNVYTGTSLVARCGLGYCSEQACITQMINNGESRIKRFLTLNKRGELIPPCGRCIELMVQINDSNKGASFYIENGVETRISDTLFVDWKTKSY